MKNPTSKPYNRYRRTLAWIGFITSYIIIPIILSITIYHFTTIRAACLIPPPTTNTPRNAPEPSDPFLGALHGTEVS